MEKQADVYTLTGKYQRRNFKWHNLRTLKDCVTIQDTGNYVQQYDFDQLKIEVEDMKIKVNEMFGTLDGDDPLGTVALRNEVASIKKALISHGIITP
jgi:hypothetical protein